MQKSLFNETLMHTKLLHAKDMKTRVANQIMEDVKEERTKIEDLLHVEQLTHSTISVMQKKMLEQRCTTHQFNSNTFFLVRPSCRPFARELLIAKLTDLGFTLTIDNDIIHVTCESNESE